MKIEYNKLVRDKIPEIIKATGKSCKIRILKQNEYTEMLKKKLEEECNEYLESGETEEIADILEVLRALAVNSKATWDEIEVMRQEKVEKRGDFTSRVLLKWVD